MEYGNYLFFNFLIFFSLSGYISSCELGQGRSAADRQFIFVNRRAVDLPKVFKRFQISIARLM